MDPQQALHVVKLSFAVFAAGVFVYVLCMLVYQYLVEAKLIYSPPRSRREVWVAACKHSATILVAKLTALAGALSGFLDNIADILGMPELKDAIDKWIGNPKILSGVLLLVAFLVWRARMRRGSLDPIVPR